MLKLDPIPVVKIGQEVSGMSLLLAIVIVLIGISIFLNGLTDAPNALAAIISTRVLSPKAAIFVGMVCNLLGIFVLGSAVAATMANIAVIGTGQSALLSLAGVELAMIVWAVLAWRYGIPTSGTHAMIFALVGAGVAYNGWQAINLESIVMVMLGMGISSFFGYGLSFLTTKMLRFLCGNMRRRPANQLFSGGQIISVCLITMANGAQDGQKFLGIIYFSLVLSGFYPAATSGSIEFPLWVLPLIAIIMTLGISVGGYRVIKRLGMKMVQLEKYQGFAAEIVASLSMIGSTLLGIPLSITHIKGASMMGAGAARGLNKVNWNIAREIGLAWLVTFPVCMFLGYFFSIVIQGIWFWI